MFEEEERYVIKSIYFKARKMFVVKSKRHIFQYIGISLSVYATVSNSSIPRFTMKSWKKVILVVLQNHTFSGFPPNMSVYSTYFDR